MGAANWVNAAQTEAEIEALRKCVNRGTPYGTETWKTQIAATLGLKSTRQPRGRPRKQLELTNAQAEVRVKSCNRTLSQCKTRPQSSTKQDLRDLRTEMRTGFENTPLKGDLWELKTDIRQGFKELRDDLREIKVALPPTLRTVAKLDLEVKDLTKRIERVERKVGLARLASPPMIGLPPSTRTNHSGEFSCEDF